MSRFFLAVAMLFSGMTIFNNVVHADPTQSAITGRVSDAISSGASSSIASRRIKLTLTIDKTKGRLEKIVYQPDNVLLQKFDNNLVLIWDFARSAQVGEYILESASSPILYDTGRLLVLRNGSIFSLTQGKNGSQNNENIFSGSVQCATVSGDKKSIFVGLKDGSIGKLTSKGAVVWKKKLFDAPIHQVVANIEGKLITVLSDLKVAKTLDENGKVINSFENVKKLGEFNAKSMQALLLESGQLEIITLNSAIIKQTPPTDVRSFSLNQNGNALLVVSNSGQLSLGLDNQWKVIDTKINDAAFVNDKRFILAKEDGVIHLQQMDQDHYLVAIIPGKSGWVIVDHEGRYDGTVDGEKDVKWSAEGATLNLDQFFQSYYQPGLLAAYVNGDEGKTLQKVPANTGEGVFPPAKIDIEFPDGKMKSGQVMKVVAVAESKGGELPDDIRLFHNGKRLPDKARIGSQRVQKNEKILLVQVFAFTPEAGVNEVFAEIRNAHGVESRSEIRHEVTDGFHSAGRLYLLGTGIDKYLDSDINLNFATADVQAVVQKLTKSNNSINKETIPQLVLDSRATKRDIVAQLAQLEKLNPEDSVILFFAGHGQELNGEWYFLPHDVDLSRLSATALSAKEIQDALVAAPPKRIFLMVDACNSGASIDSFNRFRAFQRRFVQQVGRDAGVTVLTSTRRDQFAAELSEFGHGIFTHVILEGLNGRASAVDSNGKISAHQLANYVGSNLEKLAQPYLSDEGLVQTPAHFVIGSDFLISDTGRNAP